MYSSYFGVFLLIVLGVLLAAGMLVVSALLGPPRHTKDKDKPYECGLDPKEDARNVFPVKFSVTALVFLVFDVEIAFLFPWAVVFLNGAGELGRGFLLAEMLVFMTVLAFAWLYVLFGGGLEWD